MGLGNDLGSTVREVAARETLARLRPILPEFGITRVANVTGLDTIGIPVCTVVRPFGRSLSVSQGKGGSYELAAASGIMESIEVFHAEQRRPPITTEALLECNHQPAFTAPHRLAIRSDTDISENDPIEWLRGTDLFDGGERWIPAELCDLDFSKRRSKPPKFLTSSNGLASGNSRIEAIIHGLCEVIERDQVSFWSVEQDGLCCGENRRVILDSIKDPFCLALIDKCLLAGLEVFIWRISINIDIPVFTCTIIDRRNNTPYPQQASGYGCHPIATVALARAITEAAQSRVTHISGLREDLTWSRYREEFLCESDTNKIALARITEQPATVDFGHCPTSGHRSLDMEFLLQDILRRLERAKLRSAIVVDFAENDIFSVVFVCVPDLEYKTPKASTLYTPGARMREHLKQHGVAADGPT